MADTTLNNPALLNYTALTQPVSNADVAAFRTQARMSGQSWAASRFTAGSVVSIIVFVFVIAVFGFIGLTIFGSLIAGVFSGDISALGLIVPLAFGVLAIVAIVAIARSIYNKAVPDLSSWARWYRLTNFAEANNLLFSPGEPGPSYPGAIFGIGDTRYVYDHLYRNQGRFLDIGNYRYMTGSEKSRQSHVWGFMALKLDRNLPNMVLDAKSNNGLFDATNLPMQFTKDQILQLEGDFDNYFTLYCPKEYEPDALYVFTPDLMALLIDQTQQFDVEIVDDWMFVYSSRPLNMVDIPTLNHLFKIVDTVGAKTVSQTERYADDRVASPAMNMVAPEGQRLKRRWPIIGTIVGVLVFAYWLGSFVLSFIR